MSERIYGQHYGYCALCQDESKPLAIKEWYCTDCQAQYTHDIETGAAWILVAKETERQKRNSERKEYHRVPEIAGSTDSAQPGDSLESVEDTNAVEPFADDLEFQVMTNEALDHVADICDQLHALGYEGFHPNDWNKMRMRMALETYGQGVIMVEHSGFDPRKHLTEKGMATKVNMVRIQRGLNPIRLSTFKRDFREAKKLMRLHGFSINRSKD